MSNLKNESERSWRQLFQKQRRFLIIGNICLIILSLSYYVFTKRVYSSSAIIRIGQVAHAGKIRSDEEDRQILVPISIVQSLLKRNKYPESDLQKVKIEVPWVVFGELMNKIDTINVIPEIGQKQLLENPAELSAKIFEKYKTRKKGFPILSSVNSDSEDKQIVYLTTAGNTPEEAEQFLNQIVESIIQEHQIIYSEFVNINQQYYSEVIYEINLIQRNKTLGVDEYLMKLKKEAADIKILSSKVYSKPTEMIKQPSLNYNPVKPKLLYGILFIIMGGISSILCAFFLEFKGKN